MRKIPNLFVRDPKTRKITPEINPESAWVTEDEVIATQKFDGTCCWVREDGNFGSHTLFKRYELKKGKTAPDDFIPATDVDPNTGKIQGWRLVEENDKYHLEAFDTLLSFLKELSLKANGFVSLEGTYELCGPKVQSNPEHYDSHGLVKHGKITFEEVPTDYEGFKYWIEGRDIEGVVWHHPDGRMAKARHVDVGSERPGK